MSAEEARGLLDGSGEGCPVTQMQALYAAAPDLAATVIALSEERDRLRAILAGERGEAAPEGWAWTTYDIGGGNTHGEWQRRVPGIVLALSVWRGKVGTWHWQVHPPGGTQQSVASSALEAIEDIAHGMTDRSMATRALCRFHTAYRLGRGVRLTADEVYALAIHSQIGEIAGHVAENIEQDLLEQETPE